jgi:hypothetical protein
MADVTTVFAAKDESFATTVDKLSGRLQGFQSETQSFTSKVGEMAKGFAAFVGPIAAVGAAFLGARSVVDSFRAAIDLGGRLDDLTRRTGMAAGEILVLQEAFKLGGSSADAVAPAIDRLRKAIVAAGDGSGEQAIAFAKLGINMEEIKNATPTQQLEMVASALNKVSSDTERSAFAMQIFGRSGGELLPVLRNFGVEVDKARGYLGSLPDVMTKGSEALADLGDNFTAIGNKVNQFVAGALIEIAPTINKATEALAKMDFAAMGQNLMQALQRVYDFFVGLWQRPAQVFGLLGDYLNATFRQAGDSLLSAFLTAGNALFDLLKNIVNSGAFTQLGNVLANAFWMAVSKFNLAMFDAIESVVEFFGRLWNSVTSQGVQGLATKLLDVVGFFASDFMQAMTNPAAFIANKLASALTGATKNASEEYRFAFDNATGSYIEKARAGLEAVADGSGKRLEQSASAFGSLIVDAATKTAANAKIVEVNLFGGAQAVAAVNEKVAAIAEAGVKFRLPLQDSVEPAEKIGKAIATLPESGKSLKEVMAEAFPLATAIKTEAQAMARQGQLFASSINQAKIDAEVTANVFAGLSDRMNKAVNGTSAMLDKMREAFSFGRQTTREFYDSARAAGMNINQATRAAADYTSRRNQADNDLMSYHNKLRIAENTKDRLLARAQDLEQRGYASTAFKLRLRAESQYTNKLEELRPDLEKATENAKRLMEEGGGAIKGSAAPVGQGGKDAGTDMKDGGAAAGKSIEDAADALKNVVDNINQQLALEKTLFLCKEFLKSIDEKLPQHALT